MAARGERHRDLVADGVADDGVADLFDGARALVPQDERERRGDVTVLDGEVGVAQAGGGDLHEQFVRTDVVEDDLLEGERGVLAVKDGGVRVGGHVRFLSRCGRGGRAVVATDVTIGRRLPQRGPPGPQTVCA